MAILLVVTLLLINQSLYAQDNTKTVNLQIEGMV